MGQFFRDGLASDALRDVVLRPLLERSSTVEPVRAWIIGCEDGRDAYGLALAMTEAAEQARRPVTIKIFATDPSPDALNLARAGLFTSAIEDSLPPGTLARFFEQHAGCYRISRAVRDRIVFARLDPTEDTPLSHIDVIICRVPLKRLDAAARSRVREALLFALRPGGTLFLCHGDDFGEPDDRLEVLKSAEHRIFRRTESGTRLEALRVLQTLPRSGPAPTFTPVASRPPAGPLIRSALLELCPPTIVVDLQGRVVYVHGNVSPFIGYPPGEPTQSVLELVRRPFRAAVRGALQAAMMQGRTICLEPREHDAADGIMVIAAPLRLEDGSPAFRVSFAPAGAIQGQMDSGDGDSQEEAPALRRRLQTVTEVFEATNEALAVANEELTSSNEELQSANAQLEESRRELQSANEHLSAVNEELEVKVAALRRAEARLSEALEAAEQLRAKAEEANRAKDEFISTMSHELRTPLNTIRLWSRMLASGKARADKVSEGARIIDRAVCAQRQLIDDLLDVSRMAAGQLRLAPREYPVCAVVQNAIESVRPQVESRRIALASAIDRDSGLVYVDPDRIQQVVWNLLTNAVKFTPEGGRIEVRLHRLDCVVEIEVRDTGIGIRPDFLPHVFERFRQDDGGIARRYGGLGLGLAIAKDLVELHGGTISARSAGEGRGAAFLVRLPLAGNAEQQDAASSPGPDPATRDLEGVDVLLIEDEELSRTATSQLLTQYNAHVRTASTAMEARAALESDPPDLIVADIGMPGEDGYRFLETLRHLEHERHLPRVPAIAVTAFGRREDCERALAAGFDLHLAKPVDPDGLLQAIRQLGHPGSRAPHAAPSVIGP